MTSLAGISLGNDVGTKCYFDGSFRFLDKLHYIAGGFSNMCQLQTVRYLQNIGIGSRAHQSLTRRLFIFISMYLRTSAVYCR